MTQWQGWGTALKPAWEPICLARKPLIGTVAQNVLAHGTGALNVDGCRVGTEDGYTENAVTQGINTAQTSYEHRRERRTFEPSTLGRWPANLMHDGSPEVLAGFPVNAGAAAPASGATLRGGNESVARGKFNGLQADREPAFHGDTGSAARFFYCAKASKADRDEGLEGYGKVTTDDGRNTPIDNPYLRGETTRRNHHPTVKPTDLMRYLCRLITPPGGIVLDPFMGSGSTGKAAMLEGFRFIGIDMTPEYVEIARARIEHAFGQSPLAL